MCFLAREVDTQLACATRGGGDLEFNVGRAGGQGELLTRPGQSIGIMVDAIVETQRCGSRDIDGACRSRSSQLSTATGQFDTTSAGDCGMEFQRDEIPRLGHPWRVDMDALGLPYAQQWISQEVNQLKVFSAFCRQQFG